MHVRLFEPGDLPQLQALVNLHLSAAISGWALSKATLARHLVRDERQPITDPWVDERRTYCAVDGYRVLACVHLLHYGRRPEISRHYADAGSIAWMLARPEHASAAAAVLEAADKQFSDWRVVQRYGWDTGLPLPIWGIPDAWPHVAQALERAGYEPDPATHQEALFGGSLTSVADASDPRQRI